MTSFRTALMALCLCACLAGLSQADFLVSNKYTRVLAPKVGQQYQLLKQKTTQPHLASYLEVQNFNPLSSYDWKIMDSSGKELQKLSGPKTQIVFNKTGGYTVILTEKLYDGKVLVTQSNVTVLDGKRKNVVREVKVSHGLTARVILPSTVVGAKRQHHLHKYRHPSHKTLAWLD